MYTSAALVPSLGTSTIVAPGETIRFLATIRVSEGSKYQSNEWVVELWYGYGGFEWQGASFTPSSIIVHDASSLSGTRNYVFSLELPTDAAETRPLNFTLRYRPAVNDSWIWINDAAKVDDGQILFQSPSTALQKGTPFESLFSGTDKALTASPGRSQVTGVDVFHVSAIAPVNNHEWSTVLLGQPIDLERFYATIRLRASWMIPRQGKAPFHVERDALIMGYVRSDGRHVVVLGIAGFQSTTYLRSDDDGRVVVKTRNDTDAEQMHRIVVAVGNDWRRTADAAFYSAREIARLSDAGAPEPEVEEEPAPEPAWYETWYDGLGYCTWNGLGRELTEKRILDSLQDLKDSGVFVSTVIIDDNWQSLDEKWGWQHFEANGNFPDGLRHTVQEIRRRFPHIKHVAVWHSIFGYWEGISPDGYIAKHYKTKVVKWQHGRDITVVDASDIGRLYNDFYRFLANCGIDAVKCDVQSSITQLDDGVDRRELGQAYQDAFKVAHLRYFSGRVIYCMAMQPAIYFHSLIANRNPKPLLRNSDDFFPDIPSSHAWHVFANAMNNIYTSHLNVIPDWDMFQSSLPQYGGLHAAARCISGGPIYITDSPNSHDIPLLRQMTALSVRGPDRHVIIRPSCLSLPADPYTRYNSNKLLKCRNYNGGWRGNSLLAVFNVSEEVDNSDIITLDDFTGIDEKLTYVVHSHQTGKCYSTAKGGELNVAVSLPTAGWDFFSAVPVKEVKVKGGAKIEVAALGLVSNLAGAAAVEGWSASSGSNTVEVAVKLKALGVLGYYVSDFGKRKIDDLMITMADRPIPRETVKRCDKDERVIEVDVEKAFKMLELKAGWSNEVSVKLYI